VMASRAPLDYRYALDAIMPACTRSEPISVICNIPELGEELRIRGLNELRAGAGAVALWIEPLRDSWQTDLKLLARRLPKYGSLYIIASRPLATALPERNNWNGRPLGTRPGGLRRLTKSLSQSGFEVTASYGIHSPIAVGLNTLGKIIERLGRPDLGDRLHFSARLYYCAQGHLAALSAVCLIEATKVREQW
jgi:hypothetical protein